MRDPNFTKTSITQPRDLWNKVKEEAINKDSNVDSVLATILREHYDKKEKSK